MRPPMKLLVLVASVLFLCINVGGAFMALREGEGLHLMVHVTLAVATAYLLPRIVRAVRRSRVESY